MPESVWSSQQKEENAPALAYLERVWRSMSSLFFPSCSLFFHCLRVFVFCVPLFWGVAEHQVLMCIRLRDTPIFFVLPLTMSHNEEKERMIDSFAEWFREDSGVPQAFRTYEKRLIDIGATWETFERDEAGIVDDLVLEDVPRFAAREAAFGVKERQAMKRKAAAPMAVFWDAENVHIPRGVDGRRATEALKQAVASFGKLQAFRCYLSVALGTITEQNRSALQLSGAHIVDTPHLHRKEVADKMIIVDAMDFMYSNPSGATLVLVTGDEDFAYMLAKLSLNPLWRTVVITKGAVSSNSMLDTNATVTLSWETDVLQLRLPAAPNVAAVPAPTSTAAPDATCLPVVLAETPAEILAVDDDTEATSGQATPFDEAEILDEKTEQRDNLSILRRVMEALRPTDGHVILKCKVVSQLRAKNPLRFSTRDAVRDLFHVAIQKNVLRESGTGATKRVSLVSEVPTSSELLPTSAEMPDWVFEALRSMMTRLASPDQKMFAVANKFVLAMQDAAKLPDPLPHLPPLVLEVKLGPTVLWLCPSSSVAQQCAATLSPALYRLACLVRFAPSQFLSASQYLLANIVQHDGKLLWAQAKNDALQAGFAGREAEQAKSELLKEKKIQLSQSVHGHPLLIFSE